MAMSEVFNLDFKFGGNAEFLVKLEALLNRIDSRFDSFEDDVKDSTAATEKMADSVDELNDSFKDGIDTMSRFGDKLKDIAKYYLSFTAIRAGAERIWSFGMQSMDAFATQERAENQLKGIMKNRGTLSQFQTIKDYAANIQGRSIYGDEAMIRGAGELATYVKGTGSLKSMMDLLTDYAAGMTGGGEVSPEQMESLATGLGMAYDGNYMAMRRKGFDTSKLEALDAIVENGGKWGAKERKKYGDVLDEATIKQIQKIGGVSEEMRVDALKESLKDWKGLSDTVNDLDSSALIKFNNKLGDLRENIGQRIYPVFNSFVAAVDENMPKIEVFFDRVGDMFTSMADSFSSHLDSLFEIGSHLAEILPEIVEFGLNLLQVVDDVVFKFVGFKEAIIAVGVAMALPTVIGFAKQLKLVGIEIKNTTVDFMKLRTELKFTRLEMVKSATELGRSGLNNALKGATAQMLLFGAAVWGLEKIFKFATTAVDAYRESKKAEQMREEDAKHGAAVDEYTSARMQYAANKKALENFRKAHGYRDIAGAEGYYDSKGNQIVGLENEDAFYARNVNQARLAMERAKASLSAADKARELERERIYGKSSVESNPYLKDVAKLTKEMSNGKVNLYAPTTNNYIDQRVNVTEKAENIALLLNTSIVAGVKAAMKKDRINATLGAI
jgi:hypothetical protein